MYPLIRKRYELLTISLTASFGDHLQPYDPSLSSQPKQTHSNPAKTYSNLHQPTQPNPSNLSNPSTVLSCLISLGGSYHSTGQLSSIFWLKIFSATARSLNLRRGGGDQCVGTNQKRIEPQKKTRRPVRV